MPKLLDRSGAVVPFPAAEAGVGRYRTDAGIATIAEALPGLTEVVIEFPIFRDGRGFSLARALREHHGFTGEIRAAGHTIADQFPLLVRCGFSRIEIPDDADPAHWVRALGTFSAAYQPGVSDGLATLPLRRFALGPA